jgi:hypothetical protein
MIIHDLDHLESIAETTNVDISYTLKGGAIQIILPKIEFKGFVIASSVPSAVDMVFMGDIQAGQVALMNVASGVYVRNIF